MSAVSPFIRGIALIVTLVSITGCNELTKLLSNSTADVESRIQIVGAGVKGPLAFAKVSLYALDTSRSEYFNPDKPITKSTSNAYAAIDDLSISNSVNLPVVMVIDAGNAIDLTTGAPPVITRLITVISDKMLRSRKPIYATPLTTLAFHMAMHGAGTGASKSQFMSQLADNALLLKKTFGFGVFREFDIFSTPPIINNYTSTLQQQQLVARHRAAIEAISAMIHEMAQATNNGTVIYDSNELLRDLAVDLQSDGIINDSDAGVSIGTIDPAVLNQDPMSLLIPNSVFHVAEISEVLDSDLQYLSTSTQYQKSKITVTLPHIKLDSTKKSSEIVVSWKPNADQVAGYRVYYGADPSTATNEISDIPVTTAGFDRASPAVTYDSWNDLSAQAGDDMCFRIRAYNSDGLSEFSTPICAQFTG